MLQNLFKLIKSIKSLFGKVALFSQSLIYPNILYLGAYLVYFIIFNYPNIIYCDNYNDFAPVIMDESDYILYKQYAPSEYDLFDSTRWEPGYVVSEVSLSSSCFSCDLEEDEASDDDLVTYNDPILDIINDFNQLTNLSERLAYVRELLPPDIWPKTKDELKDSTSNIGSYLRSIINEVESSDREISCTDIEKNGFLNYYATIFANGICKVTTLVDDAETNVVFQNDVFQKCLASITSNSKAIFK